VIPTLENTFLIPGAASGLFGFAAGYALKKVLKFVIIGIGLLSLVIAYLEMQKWINVNWPIVENQTTAIAEHIASKGYAMTQHIGTELGVGAAGFSIGLLIGLARG
jgi:uncharacterized membrane protein (Fun14 family)